jgi:hypothetical protein
MTTQAKPLGKRIKDVVLVAALVASQALATLMGGAATTAYAADGDTLTVAQDSNYVTDNGIHLWTASTGVPMFCADPENQIHATAADNAGTITDMTNLSTVNGHTYNDHDRAMIDYITYYATTYIQDNKSWAGVSGSDLQAAAQFAIWGIRWGNINSPNIPYSGNGSHATALTAAKTIYAQASAFADNTASDPTVPLGSAMAFIPTNNKQAMTFMNSVGSISLVKTSANPTMTDGNTECYSLEGAVYTVTDTNGKTVGTITTNAEGKGELKNIKKGDYKVKETTAPKGYALDPKEYPVTVNGKAVELAVKDVPQNDPVAVLVEKKNAETNDNKPTGGATLANTEFTVNYYNGYYTKDNLPEKPTRSWVIKTDEDGYASLSKDYIVSGDELYLSSDNKATIPLGTITVKESKAPKGYLLPENTELNVQQIKPNGVLEVVDADIKTTQPEQIMRGDFKFVKAIENTQTRVDKALFKVTSKTTGETHYIVTDANGGFNSADIKHSEKTNANDAAVAADGTVDESKLDPEAGIWFSGTKDKEVPVNDAKGALPYDTYDVTEITTSATEGTKPVTFSVTIFRDGTNVDMGTVDDQPGDTPKIQTEFTDLQGSHDIEPDKEVKLHDTVAYNNLTPGKEYTMTMTIHVVDTNGKDEGELKDKDGKPVTASVTFTPESPNGTVEVPYTINTSSLEGKSIVAFESLTKDGKEVATHADINDKGQTINVKKKPSKSVPQTGQEQDMFRNVAIGASVLALAAIGYVVYKKRNIATA